MRISDWSSDVCSSDLFQSQATEDEITSRVDLQSGKRLYRNAKSAAMQAPLWLNRLDEISAACAIITKVIPKPSQPGPIASVIEHRLTSSTMRSRTEEHTFELQSLMRKPYDNF